MKKLNVYVAVAAATMSIVTAVPAQAAVKMFVVNGNANGNTNSTCFGGGSQNVNLSDVLSSLYSSLPSSFSSCGNGNQLSGMDALMSNLSDKGCLYSNQNGQINFNCPSQNTSDPNCWWSCPDQNQSSQNGSGQNCPDQNRPNQNRPNQNQPGQNQPSQNQPNQNQPNQNQPSQNQPNQNQPSQNQPNQNQSGQNQPSQNQPSQGSSSDRSYAQQIIDLVNEERGKAGLASVNAVESITGAANVRAKEIVSNFSHTRPDGTEFGTVLRQAGINYRGAGENIAYGQRTPEEVMNAWMNSSGHRANILNPNYTNIGIGYYEANGVKYWVQLFTY